MLEEPSLDNPHHCPAVAVAGGKPFKDAGDTIAHGRAQERLVAYALPDETLDTSRTIELGGTTRELH